VVVSRNQAYQQLLGCSERFVENVWIIKGAEYDERRSLSSFYRLGYLSLRALLRLADEVLDDENLELLMRNLFRKQKTGKTDVDIDIAHLLFR